MLKQRASGLQLKAKARQANNTIERGVLDFANPTGSGRSTG